MCWARNAVGDQHQPCFYQIIPAGEPDSLTDCIATNITSDAVQISCLPGFDGGLPQKFQVDVTDLSNGRKMFNGIERMSHFVIGRLEPGRTYEFKIWAVNNKGKSDPQIVHLTTLAQQDKDNGTEPIGKACNTTYYSLFMTMDRLNQSQWHRMQ